MRKKYQFISLLLVIIITETTCKKHGISSSDPLPPATQIGANTFGCYINGKAFTPGGSAFSGSNLGGIYEYAYSSPVPIDSPIRNYVGYVFAVSASDLRDPCNISQIGFRVDSIAVVQGATYLLKSEAPGNGVAQYNFLSCSAGDNRFLTTDSLAGQLHLTKFDLTNQIVSGTFWFNVLDSLGDTIKITDGRFDIRFIE